MDIKVFKKLISKELNNLGFTVIQNDKTLFATNSDCEVEVDLETVYSEFVKCDDEKTLCDFIIKKIQLQIKKSKVEIDLDKVCPILKRKGYGQEIEPNLIRDDFSFDLELLYAIEKENNLKFLLESDGSQLIKEHALRNLENNFIFPVLENVQLNIYKYPFPSHLNASMIILPRTREFLLNKIGKKVLVVITSEAFILYAKETETSLFYLSKFLERLKEDEDNITISNNLYRWDLIHNTLTNLNIKSSLSVISN